jgi:hypothetical protein
MTSARDTATHPLGAPPHDRGNVLVTRRHGHESRARAQCSLAGHPCRAGHADVAADHEHAALLTLVRGSPTRRQQLGHCGFVDERRCSVDVRQCLRRQLERIEHDDAGAVRTFAEIEAELEPDERERARSPHCDAEHLAGVGVQAARDIERQHGLVALIHRCDGLRRGPCNRARQADAENRIDDDVGSAQTIRVPLDDRPTRGNEVVVRPARVALQSSGLVQADSDDLQPPRTSESRQNVTIAAVVTRPADDREALRGRPATAQRTQRSFSGASHQRVGRNLQLFDRVPVQRTHLVRCVNGDGQTTHARSLPKRILLRA